MRILLLGAVLLVTVAGCGVPGAAEPGVAPPVAVTPAGRVVTVGDDPEGLVADPVTHLVAVGVRNPDGLALLDGRTGDPVRRVPLPGHLRHLQLAAPGGPVLVPDESSGALLEVGLPAGAPVRRTAVGRYPHDAARAADGTDVVADELGGALAFVRDGVVVHRDTGLTQPGGVAATGTGVAVIDVHEHTLGLYSTDPPARRARVPAGAGPTHLVADRGGRLFVVDTRADRLLVFSTVPRLASVLWVSLPGHPYGMALDGTRNRLWITLTGRNQLVGLDVSGPVPREFARYPTVRQPNTVATDPATGRVFVAGRADGQLQLVDPPA